QMRGIDKGTAHSREGTAEGQAPNRSAIPGRTLDLRCRYFLAVMRKRTAAMATIAVPRRTNASPARLANLWPGNEKARPANEGAATSRNKSNFSTRNPKAITVMAVRTQARNVRSLAAWSL